MKTSAASTIGWMGVLAILAAYIGVSSSILPAHSVPYLILNLAGAAAILFEAATKKDYQPVVLNVIWAAIAIYGLIRVL